MTALQSPFLDAETAIGAAAEADAPWPLQPAGAQDLYERDAADDSDRELFYEHDRYGGDTEGERAGDDYAEPEYADDPFEHDISAIDRQLKENGRRLLLGAIAAGEHDEGKLANLLFFDRHPELDKTRPLDPKGSAADAKLAAEWSAIGRNEVWPAIEAAATDPVLAVQGAQVAGTLKVFRGAAGRRFKQLVETAAQQVGLNPGLLAAVLIAETGSTRDYLTASRVNSYRTGVDDFYEMRNLLAKNVPAYARIGWDRTQTPDVHLNDAKDHPRSVHSIWFNSGPDALLATAVYLKYAEVRIRADAVKLGGDFDALPVEVRFALTRMCMAAGRAGTAPWLAKAVKGQDIMVRNWKPPKIYQTGRNATIRAAEAMFLSRWIFGQPLAAAPAAPAAQPEYEAFADGGATGFGEAESDGDGFRDGEFENGEFDDSEFDDREFDDDAVSQSAEGDEEAGWNETREPDDEAGDDADAGLQTYELDPAVVDFTEQTMAREIAFEDEAAKRWTTCFSPADIAKVIKVYEDNLAAVAADGSLARCSCIVMLNVALGQLLSLPLKANLARGKSKRIVQMGALTTDTIEEAMAQLQRKGYAAAPKLMNFFDSRRRTAGTLKPERLKASVRDRVLAIASTEGCWSALGLSVMNGYHSVLLLVDRTGADARIYWLDQFSAGLDVDVTGSLDQRLTDRSREIWQFVNDTKHKGYSTTIRLWQLRKRRKAP